MASVPVELLLAIVDWVEDSTVLFNLRLVSHTFNAVAAPLVFRVLYVRDSVQSAEGLACFQASDPATRSAVQEIVFDGDPIGRGSWSDEYITGQPGRDALFAAFSGLAKFPALHTLRFKFYPRFQELETSVFPENPSHFLLLQLGLFAVLAAHPMPSLTSLELTNLIPVPHNIYATQAFQNFFRPLTTLRISVLSDRSNQDARYADSSLCDFWEASIPSILKISTRLTSLTMRSDYPVGIRPASPLAFIHLPMLTTLSLDNFVLDPARADYDIVESIVRHKATLTQLELFECSVYSVEKGVYPRPWHTVFQRFRQELLGLRALQLVRPGAADDDTVELEYLYPSSSFPFCIDPEAGRQARVLDEAALQSLISAMKSDPTP
ncbi:hypothetical protein K438DRAFT_1885001 [Mycena galopus ATCC 62051]|nr:hypothetical protein K438DRAFT_1885001 [Mycena galopus ATCC 62051]